MLLRTLVIDWWDCCATVMDVRAPLELVQQEGDTVHLLHFPCGVKESITFHVLVYKIVDNVRSLEWEL